MPSSGAKTLKEFIDRRATSAKPLTYSSSGVGSSGHLFGENLAHLAGVKFEHVPYKGASQGLTDLAGGHIAFSVQTVSSSAALVRGGTLRALAHTGKTRLPDFPDIPTFKELGYDMVALLWFSISGPAHLPKDITEKVNAEINRAVQSPEVEARLRRDGLIADPMSVEEFNKFIDAEMAVWKPGMRARRIDRRSELALPDPERQHPALLAAVLDACRRSRASGSGCRSRSADRCIRSPAPRPPPSSTAACGS